MSVLEGKPAVMKGGHADRVFAAQRTPRQGLWQESAWSGRWLGCIYVFSPVRLAAPGTLNLSRARGGRSGRSLLLLGWIEIPYKPS